MNQKKVHSVGKVPFSWEKAPGVCKAPSTVAIHDANCELHKTSALKNLPPPPCPTFHVGHCSPKASSDRDLHIPLPPCPFQADQIISRSSSKKGLDLRKVDPFLAAYMECTKSKGGSRKGMGGLRAGMEVLSCKQSCKVREDNLVKVVHLRSARHSRSNQAMVHDHAK